MQNSTKMINATIAPIIIYIFYLDFFLLSRFLILLSSSCLPFFKRTKPEIKDSINIAAVATTTHGWLKPSIKEVRSIAVKTYFATSRNHFPNSSFIFMLQMYELFSIPPNISAVFLSHPCGVCVSVSQRALSVYSE